MDWLHIPKMYWKWIYYDKNSKHLPSFFVIVSFRWRIAYTSQNLATCNENDGNSKKLWSNWQLRAYWHKFKIQELKINWKFGRQSIIKSKVQRALLKLFSQLFWVLGALLNSKEPFNSLFNVFIARIACELRSLHPSFIQYFLFDASY